MIDTPQEVLRKRQSPLTVEILREQLLQVPGECVVAVDDVKMSQASFGISDTIVKPGAKLSLTFVPLNPRSCGCTIPKRDPDCRLHREGP